MRNIVLSFLKTSLYVKNVSTWERVVRILVGLVVIAVGWFRLESPWNWIAALVGLGFGLTGVVGVCPACAMMGRRIGKR